MTRMTLEQQRAADAWAAAAGCTGEYVKLAKGVPALIMNSGLMQTLAFLEGKEEHHRQLAHQLRRWLAHQYPDLLGQGEPDYQQTMKALLRAGPRAFQDVTAEALAWLRWVRQFAPTRKED